MASNRTSIRIALAALAALLLALPAGAAATVRVSGKLVACDEGQELVIEKAAKI